MPERRRRHRLVAAAERLRHGRRRVAGVGQRVHGELAARRTERRRRLQLLRALRHTGGRRGARKDRLRHVTGSRVGGGRHRRRVRRRALNANKITFV